MTKASSVMEETVRPLRRANQGVVEPCDVRRHRNEIISLFQREGKARFADRFEWYYGAQGEEEPRSWVLRGEQGKICGLCSVTTRFLRYGRQIIKAGIAGNLIVDRTKGNYLGAFSLVRAMMPLVDDGDIAILLGSPNSLSQPVFHRMGFQVIDLWKSQAMIYRSRPLLQARFGLPGAFMSPLIDLGAAARRILSRRSLANCSTFSLREIHEDEIQSLRLDEWRMPPDSFVVRPSSNYLFWRFLQDPVTPCNVFAVLDQSGDACGYLACRHVGNRIVVADCAVDTERTSDTTAIACLCQQLEAQNSGVWVTTLRSSPLSSELSSYGFVTSPSRKRDGVAPLVGYWLPNHPLSKAFARPASWNLFPGFNDVMA